MAQADTQAPTAPSGLTNTVTAVQVVLNWNASTDNVGVADYVIGRCSGVFCSGFSAIATTTGTTYTDNAVVSGFHYSYIVKARDSVPNVSTSSNVSSAVPLDGVDDTEAPTVPSAVTATAVSPSQINLSWTASTDNVRVIGYELQRCQGGGCSNFNTIVITQVAVTTYSDTGLATSTSYSYRLRAHDEIPHWSDYSSTANATTQATLDTQAPTAPADLNIAAAANQSTLTWTASTDNVAVVEYLIERCQGPSCSAFALLGSTSATTYADTTAIAGLSYSYRVRARDAVPNYSNYSATGSAIPADCD